MTEPNKQYICGLFDEHEFMQQLPPHYGFVAHGPYDTIEEAQAKARTLSSDPDEAVVLELIKD